MAHHETKYEHSHHAPMPIGTLVAVFLILTLLMGATMFAAQFPTPNSWINNIVAMAIATIKATLVIWYFMGVKNTTKLGKLYCLLGFLWAPLLLMMFCDYMTRHYEPSAGWTGEKKLHFTQGNWPQVKHTEPAEGEHGTEKTENHNSTAEGH